MSQNDVPDTAQSPTVPWEQQPGESDLWFNRFEFFRLLGPSRTLDATFRHSAAEEKQDTQIEQTGANRVIRGRADGNWHAAVAKWRWRDRAAAWDAVQREAFRKRKEAELSACREETIEDARRLRRISRKYFNAMETAPAKIPKSITFDQATKMLEMAVAYEEAAIKGDISNTLAKQVEDMEKVVADLKNAAGGTGGAGSSGESNGEVGGVD